MTEGSKQVFRLGPRSGAGGDSTVWEVKYRGRTLQVEEPWLLDQLKKGRLTGIESVRRTDGDWGPLFGRTAYRKVFKQRGLEPRDHAKERARQAIATHRRITRRHLIGAFVAVFAALPVFFTPMLSQLFLFFAAAQGIAAGFERLRATMLQHELDSLVDQLQPPIKAPPPIEDWALQAAQDEVEHYLAGETTGSEEPGI